MSDANPPDALLGDFPLSPEGCVVVVCGGEQPPPEVRSLVPPDALVIAADSGAAHAVALGLPVHIVVGDMDSVDEALLRELKIGGSRVEVHPVAKDSTDLELALARAVGLGATEIVVVGGHGGRLDHLLGNLFVLGSPLLAEVRVTAHMGGSTVHVVRDRLTWEGRVGDLVTIFAVGTPAIGVRTEGLRYPLRGESLLPASTRGVSNELVDASPVVSLESGALLVLRPLATSPAWGSG